MTLRETIVIVVAVIGVFFTLVSAIGIVRLPDVYARMHAAGKASTLGVSALLLSAGFFFPGSLPGMVILIALFFVTAPVATTAMARATYRTDSQRHFTLHYDDIAMLAKQEKNAAPSPARATQPRASRSARARRSKGRSK